jgi:CBS domain-containing protein
MAHGLHEGEGYYASPAHRAPARVWKPEQGGCAMQVQKMMTSNPACVTPDDTIRDAARLMKEHDCGLIPVVDSHESKRLVGVVTDRDLALRAIGEGKGADTEVSQVMSRDASVASPDTDV